MNSGLQMFALEVTSQFLNQKKRNSLSQNEHVWFQCSMKQNILCQKIFIKTCILVDQSLDSLYIYIQS